MGVSVSLFGGLAYRAAQTLATGIDYVLVNGTLVVDGGQHTAALAGRALRRGRD